MVQVGPESFSDPKYDFGNKINDFVMKVAITASK
jgi:hypothetical protein